MEFFARIINKNSMQNSPEEHSRNHGDKFRRVETNVLTILMPVRSSDLYTIWCARDTLEQEKKVMPDTTRIYYIDTYHTE